MCKFSLILVFAALLLLPGCAQNRNMYVCDPSIEGFWRNLGCGQYWEERQQIRKNELLRLQNSYVALQRENARLVEQKSAKEELIEHLRREAEVSRQNLLYVEQARLDVENAKQTVQLLRDEMAYVAQHLDAALQLEVGCETREYRNARAEAEFHRTVVAETAKFGFGEFVGWAAKEVVVFFTPGKLKKPVRQALNGLSAAGTLVAASQAADAIDDAYKSSKIPVRRTACL